MKRKTIPLLLVLLVISIFGCKNNAINNTKIDDYTYNGDELEESIIIVFGRWLNDRKDGTEVEVNVEYKASEGYKTIKNRYKSIENNWTVGLVSNLDSGKPIILACGSKYDAAFDKTIKEALYVSDEKIKNSKYNIDMSKCCLGYIKMVDVNVLGLDTFYSLYIKDDTGKDVKYLSDSNEFEVIDETILPK